MTNALTVSEILERGVFIEWFEGIALVRELAQRLSGDSEPSSLPDLDQIAVSPDGGIVVLGRAAIDDPVRRFGQLLQAVLSQSEPPVQLRLLISQATAPGPVFSSIREYDRALEFFDRPNRSAALQALFARAAAAPAPVERKKPATVESIAPLPAAKAAKADTPAREPKPASGRTLRLVAVAGALVLVSVVVVLYARAAGTVPQAIHVSDAALEVSDTLGSAITSGLSAVSEQVGLGRLVFGSETTATPAATAGADVKATVTRQRTPMRPNTAQVTRLDLERAPLVDAAGFGPALEPRGEDLEAEAPPTEADPATYSLGSEGVSPPVGVGPQLPRQVPTGSDPSTLGQIELIIRADGTVESAKLVGSPRHVVDSMLLSALKTWEFQPAMKDGRPVRYRKTVWLASQ
ncbi:MAG: energy transducer TonB [Vicinamibacterales bacterium]